MWLVFVKMFFVRFLLAVHFSWQLWRRTVQIFLAIKGWNIGHIPSWTIIYLLHTYLIARQFLIRTGIKYVSCLFLFTRGIREQVFVIFLFDAWLWKTLMTNPVSKREWWWDISLLLSDLYALYQTLVTLLCLVSVFKLSFKLSNLFLLLEFYLG